MHLRILLCRHSEQAASMRSVGVVDSRAGAQDSFPGFALEAATCTPAVEGSVAKTSLNLPVCLELELQTRFWGYL